MVNAHIDASQGLDGEPIVLAVFDLAEHEVSGSAHVVAATVADRFRNAEMSADDVLELRELTALRDDLGALTHHPGMKTVVLRPARLNALRDAIMSFVTGRDEAEWMRDEDREPLAAVRALLWPLEDLCADAMRAALSPPAPRPL